MRPVAVILVFLGCSLLSNAFRGKDSQCQPEPLAENNPLGAGVTVDDYVMKTIHEYDGKGRKIRTVEYGAGGVTRRAHHFFYDARGQLSQEMKYDNEGDLLERIEISYDAFGNLTEQITYDQNNNILTGNYYRYDKAMNRTKWRHYRPGEEEEWIRLYSYDKQGNRLEEKWLDPPGTLSRLYVYDYDNHGNCVGQNVYGGDGKLQWRYVYDYDQHGMRIAVKWYNEDNQLRKVRTFRYDEVGNRVEQRRYRAYRRLFSRALRYHMHHSFVYTYDNNNNPLQQKVYDDRNRLVWWIEKVYDPNGNLTAYKRFNPSGSKEMSYRMTYNNDGLKTGWSWRDGDGNEEWRRVYRYDERGRLVEEIWY